MIGAMKSCPFCAESIQNAAVVCRFCRSELGNTPAPRPLPGFPVRLIVLFGVVLVLLAGIAVGGYFAARRKRERSAPHASVPVEKRLTWTIRKKTWRSGEAPYDIESDLREKLRSRGIEMHNALPDADGHLDLEFEETRGQQYTIGYASVLTLKVVLKAGAGGEVLHAFTLSGQSSSFLIRTTPYQASVDEFRKNEGYESLASIVGAAFGIRRFLPTLLPLLERSSIGEEIAQVLKRQNFEPGTDEERAVLAAHQGDYETCRRLGASAVEPLTRRLKKLPTNPAEAAKIVRVLGEIGDRRAAETLRTQLDTERRWLVGAERIELAVALIEALGRLKDTESRPMLEELSRSSDAAIAGAAKKSLERIRG